ncbi:MAG: T9SS type A sorting domain-containing protein [Calditrichia bacterium]
MTENYDISELVVNDNIELTSLSFSEKIRETGFVSCQAAFADGAITISVERDGQNDVWVSQMMLKETGRSFAVISAGDKSVLPEGYELADNFPNPFNPETTIRFRTPQTGVVRLEIFNILGQKVAELVNRELPSGEHAARWNGANSSGEQVASGFYFYRLTAGTFQQTRRMLLLK